MKKLGRPVEKLLSSSEAHKLLAPYYDEINAAVREGLSIYQTIPAQVRAAFKARTAAGALNDLIIKDAIRRFDGQEPKISINDDYEGTLFVFGDKAAVRFKKVATDLRPSNITTKRQRSMECQLEIEGIVPCTLLSIAYVVDETFTKVQRVHLVCWNSGIRRWAMTISKSEIEPFLFAIREGEQKNRVLKTARVRSKSGAKKKGG